MLRSFLKVGIVVLLLVVAAVWRLGGQPFDESRAPGSPTPLMEQAPMKVVSDIPQPPPSRQARKDANIESIDRRPSAALSAGVPELEAESTHRWSFKRNPGDGYVIKMAEGRLTFGDVAPEVAVGLFLKRYGKNVLGFSAESAGEPSVRREEVSTQVVVPQVLNGLNVYGARGNFIFDASGGLIYVTSNVYRGAMPPSPSAAVTIEHAALSARRGLLHFLEGRGDPAAYPIDDFLGQLQYRLVGNTLSLIYRYELPLVPPLIGDMEIMVDAADGAVVLIENQTRK